MSAALLLAEMHLRGIRCRPAGDGLAVRPADRLTPDLAKRIKANKQALMTLFATLEAAGTTPPAATINRRDGPESGVLSVVSESEPLEPTAAGRGLWSEDELAMLGRKGITPADLPLVSAVKDAFAEHGATVIGVETSHGRGGDPNGTRRRAAGLIRHARRQSPGLAVAMRDAWAERLAVCTIDGGLTEGRAEAVALAELETMLY